MNARWKELRPLWLPFWLTMVLAAVLPLVRMLNNPALLGDAATLWGLLMMLTQLSFFSGILVLAVLPFGIEFQYQTLTLLLSQPRSRWRIWKTRTLLGAVLIGFCAVVHWISHVAVMLSGIRDAIESAGLHMFGQPNVRGFITSVSLSDVSEMDMLAISGFMLATACTAGFWT